MSSLTQVFQKEKELIKRYLDLYKPDSKRLALARERQKKLFNQEKPDRAPIIFYSPLTPEQEKLPNPDFHSAFYDLSLMMCQQLRGALGALNSNSDVVPSIRVNTGTGTALSTVGLEQDIFKDKMPWLKNHLSKEEIWKLTPNDITIKGTMERVLDYTAVFRECLCEAGLERDLPIYVADQQGPFDLAHLMRGDDLFIDLYDDSEFVHHLMELSLVMGERVTTWCKEASGEKDSVCHHMNTLYAENLGIRICEDTTVLVSDEMMREFALPYTDRLAKRFGGAWVHYCGRNDALTKACCELPSVKGINFGLIPGKEEDHIYDEDMRMCLDTKTVSIMNWPKHKNETREEYLSRMFLYANQGALLPNVQSALGEGGFKNGEEVLEHWEKLT